MSGAASKASLDRVRLPKVQGRGSNPPMASLCPRSHEPVQLVPHAQFCWFCAPGDPMFPAASSGVYASSGVKSQSQRRAHKRQISVAHSADTLTRQV